jgi:hypothetical protein
LAPSMRDASICFWYLITPGGYYRAVAVCAGGWAMWSGFSELRFVTGLGWGGGFTRVATGCVSGSLLPPFRFITPPIGVHCLGKCGIALDHEGAGRKNGDMDRDHVIASLRANERQLKEAGIVRLSLFGSTARNEAGPDSDVDLLALFEIVPTRHSWNRTSGQRFAWRSCRFE